MKNTLIFLLIFTFFSCASHRSLDFQEISLGRSGGFTGQGIEYRINNKGLVTKIVKDSIIIFKQLNNKDMNVLKTVIEDAKLDSIEINEYGNMTYFIEIKKLNNSKIFRWTDTSNIQKLKEIYKSIFKTIKK